MTWRNEIFTKIYKYRPCPDGDYIAYVETGQKVKKNKTI